MSNDDRAVLVLPAQLVSCVAITTTIPQLRDQIANRLRKGRNGDRLPIFEMLGRLRAVPDGL